MEFLFDDRSLDRICGARKRLGKAEKLAEPVILQEHPWEADGISPKMAVFHDRHMGVFRMYYGARGGERKRGVKNDAAHSTEQETGKPRGFICYAESPNGICWSKPELNKVEFEGSTKNNIIAELGGDTVFCNVICDPHDPDPARRYKALGFGHGHPRTMISCVNNGVAVSFSRNGFDWEPATLIADTRDLTDMDCVLPCRDPVAGKWTAYFRPRTSPKRRYIGLSESDDFVNWTSPRMILTPDSSDSEWLEFYGLCANVISGWRVGLLWRMFNHPDSGFMTNELVYSRNGRDYHRAMPNQQFLPLGGDEDIDARGLWPCSIIECDDEIYIYSMARNSSHGANRDRQGNDIQMTDSHTPPGQERRAGITLSRLPCGRFCGYEAVEMGEIETKWLTNYGAHGLEVVADIHPHGGLQVELLDVHGKTIPGWTREKSRFIPKDNGKHHIVWSSDGRLDGRYLQESSEGGVVGHVLKIRFHLRRAALYGFNIGETERLDKPHG